MTSDETYKEITIPIFSLKMTVVLLCIPLHNSCFFKTLKIFNFMLYGQGFEANLF